MSGDRLKVGESLTTCMRSRGVPIEKSYPCEMSRLFATHKAGKCGEHGPFYESLLWPYVKLDDVRLLEIGIGGGGSLRAYAEYLPDAKLYGIDINPAAVSSVATVIHGDQAEPAFMRRVVALLEYVDIVIDDGGHKADQQQTSFEYLWPIVKAGGYYVIEDLYVCEKPGFRTEGLKSTLEYIEGLMRQGLDCEFHYCQGFDRDICVIHKSQNTETTIRDIVRFG